MKNELSVKEYMFFRRAVGWDQIEESVVEESLKNDLFSLCVYRNEKPIAMGRIVGDGAIYFYLQDIIVLPEYSNQGFGKLVMEQIELYLSSNTSTNSFVGLISAKGVKGFYEKFGYKPREIDAPGMFKTY